MTTIGDFVNNSLLENYKTMAHYSHSDGVTLIMRCKNCKEEWRYSEAIALDTLYRIALTHSERLH